MDAGQYCAGNGTVLPEGRMTIDKGDVTGGDVWLKQGGASWLGEKERIRCRWII